MEKKPDKKKESIDEILSDLNGLLNKMPSILDGIKMPEMQPPDLPVQETVKEEYPALRPEAGTLSAAADNDKTVVLQPFSGLEEGAPAPSEAPPAAEPQPAAISESLPVAETPEPAASFDADKTVVLEPFSGLQEGAPVPEPENLAPQSLGDFLYSPDSGDVSNWQAAAPSAPAKLSGSFLEPPPEKTVTRPSGPSLSISEFTPPAEAVQGSSGAWFPEEFPSAAPEASLQAAPDPADSKHPSLPAFDNTRDFGIPDIDALIQMSDSGTSSAPPEQPLQEAGVIPENVRSVQESLEEPSIQGMAAEEPPQADPEVEVVAFNEPKEGNIAALPGSVEQIQQEAQPPMASDSPFDAFAIEPVVSAAVPGQAEAEVPVLEPSGEMPQAQAGGEGLNFETPAEVLSGTVEQPIPGGSGFELSVGQPVVEGGDQTIPGGAGMELSVGQPVVEGADQTIPGGAGMELSVGQPAVEGGDQTIPGGAGMELSVGQPAVEGADQTIPGGAGMELSVGQPAGGEGLHGGSGMVLGGSSADSGDATLVISPPSGSSGDEDKTIVFQSMPSTTSRAQAGDLDDLAAKQAPDGIPAERLRTLMFLYAPEDKALCATALAELDAICLKSATKPMFIKRASVKECEPDANANFIQQTMTESGAHGLVCLGAVPQEKVYEIENVFGTSGAFFRYYDSSTFSHSAALDLVTDLILR